MSFGIVLVGLAVFLIAGSLVRSVAERLIPRKAAHANPNGFLLRLDLERSLVGFQNSAHVTNLKCHWTV